jgi:hypothetical protein
MRDLRTLLWVLFGLFAAAAVVSLIPVVGTVLAWLLALFAVLAFLFGGNAIQNNAASAPSDQWGGPLSQYDSAAGLNSTVDLVYCYGRWVYDSLHMGWNELHPLHFVTKIGQISQNNLNNGVWPDLGALQSRLDVQIATNNDPSSRSAQRAPENQWTLHPLLDGCIGERPYPDPPAPSVLT